MATPSQYFKAAIDAHAAGNAASMNEQMLRGLKALADQLEAVEARTNKIAEDAETTRGRVAGICEHLKID